jgi:glycyl-tRNA synthetase
MATRFLLARCICGPLRRSGALRRAAGTGGLPPGRRVTLAAPAATPFHARARAVGTAAAAAPSPTVSTGATPRGTGSGGAPGQGPTFQQAIQRLTDYWASVGCAVYLPHNTEVRPCA